MTESQKKYKFGIVGCGTIAAVHAEAIRSLDCGELVAACSRSSQNLQRFCDIFDIKGYDNYQEFLNSDIDVVVLCTPNGTHLAYGKKAADVGKHLIIEKPIEINVAKGRELVAYCKEKHVEIAVIYQNRFIEGVRKLKHILNSNTIGQLVMVSATVKWFRDQDYYKNAPWRGSLQLDGGGALINQSIHTVDLMLWLAGPVRQVHAFKATLTHEGIEGEDNLVASIQFENGALGTFQASTSITPSQNRRIEFHGSKGTAVLDGDEMYVYADGYQTTKQNPEQAAATGGAAAIGGAAATGGASSPLAGFSNSHHAAQYQQIVQQLTAGYSPPITGEESMNALAFVEAAYMSAEQQTPVRPDSLYPFIAAQED